MKFKYLKAFAVAVLALGAGFTSCSDDDLDPTSIFDLNEGALDPASPTYKLDKFCEDNLRQVYNVSTYYRLQDVMSDMNYNLVPARYELSVDLAVLCKYFWFDVYQEVVEDKTFLMKYGPRILHFIGSPAVNPANHTVVLGLAEGGIKISLFDVNAMDVTDALYLNDRYFHTMHHEFAHVLHQTKTYPKEFDSLSVGNYDALGWQDRPEGETASLGFTTPYASSEPREDFAETISNYITLPQDQWDALLKLASQNYNGKDDGVDGKALILQKVDIARNWFRDSWQMDIDALRAEVQKRQTEYNVDLLKELRKQVEDIQVPAV